MSNNAIQDDVVFGIMPVMGKERIWGSIDMIIMLVGFGVASWCFLLGGWIAGIVDFRQSLGTILFGNAISIFLLIPFAIYFSRYGIDTFVGTKAVFGQRGNYIAMTVILLLNLGWIAVCAFMFGESAIKIAKVLNAPEFLLTRETGAPVFAILAFLVALLVGYKGPNWLCWFTRLAVPGLFLVLIGLIGVAFWGYGLDAIVTATPSAPYETSRGVATSFEWSFGIGIGWIFYFGNYCRLAKSEKAAMNGAFFGWGILLCVATIVGVFSGILAHSEDPTDWMITLGGPAFGLVGLFMIMLANITSTALLIYSQGIILKTAFPKMQWKTAVLLALFAIIFMVSPKVYDTFNALSVFQALIYSCMGGVLIADIFFVRKYRVSVKDLYDPKGIYTYWYGFNIPAWISIGIGFCIYLWLLNPLTDTAHPIFSFTSGGLPVFIITGIIYMGLYRMNITLGHGDYKKIIEDKMNEKNKNIPSGAVAMDR